MTYHSELCNAMIWLSDQTNTLFLGQAVAYPGTAMSTTLGGVPKDKLLELPVMEEAQLGMCIGLSLAGFVPISIFTRWNFLLLAANQLVNHLDKLPVYSAYRPKVIIRTGIGSSHPMNPGPQHLGDFTLAFYAMCKNVEFVRLDTPEMIVPAYQRAFQRDDGKSTVLVEISDLLNG